jgi:hypothetical protein
MRKKKHTYWLLLLLLPLASSPCFLLPFWW